MLGNQFGEQGANTIIDVAKGKPHLTTLCGFKPEQTEADLSNKYLGFDDAMLLAYDLSINSVLVKLECAPWRPESLQPGHPSPDLTVSLLMRVQSTSAAAHSACLLLAPLLAA